MLPNFDVQHETHMDFLQCHACRGCVDSDVVAPVTLTLTVLFVPLAHISGMNDSKT